MGKSARLRTCEVLNRYLPSYRRIFVLAFSQGRRPLSLAFEKEERKPKLAVWKECVSLTESALANSNSLEIT